MLKNVLKKNNLELFLRFDLLGAKQTVHLVSCEPALVDEHHSVGLDRHDKLSLSGCPVADDFKTSESGIDTLSSFTSEVKHLAHRAHACDDVLLSEPVMELQENVRDCVEYSKNQYPLKCNR